MIEKNAASEDCPEAEKLAAFVEGRLDPPRRLRLITHLLSCEDCYEVVCATGFVLEELGETAPAPNVRRFPSRPFLIAAAAAILVLVAGAPLLQRTFMRVPAPIDALATAVAGERPTEGRIAGFDYAPQRAAVRGEHPVSFEVLAAAARVEKEIGDNDDPESLRTRAIAQLVTGRAVAAVALLERANKARPSAAVRSDLSAAYLSRGNATGAPADFVRALEFAEQALSLEPQFAPAAFNRALAIEAQDLVPEDAVAAWGFYLAIDPSSAWSAEARRHRDELKGRAKDVSAVERRDAIHAAVRNDSREEVERLTRAAPQAARVVVEETLLPDWAAAVGRDSSDARALRGVEAIGRVLSEMGDPAIADTLGLLNATGPEERRRLAGALTALARARRGYREGRFEEGLEALHQARAGLDGPGAPFHPIALQAALLEGSLRFVRRELDPAAAGIDRALAHSRHYPSLSGRLHWVAGLIASTSGRPFEALRFFQLATEQLSSVGESESSAASRGLMAQSLELLGESSNAWDARLEATRELLRAGPTAERWHVALFELADAAHRQGFDHMALLLSGAIAARASRDVNPERAVDALQVRAAALAALGRDTLAQRDLDDAVVWAGRIDDQRARERTLLFIECAAAETWSRRAPERALQASDRAVRRASRLGDRPRLIELHLIRGRLLRRTSRVPEAEQELRRGRQLLDSETASIPDESLRVSHSASAASIIEELVGILADQNRDAEAFELVARTRGSVLRRRLGDAPDSIRLIREADSDAVVLVYEVLDDATLLWAIHGRNRSRMTIPEGREALAQRVAAFRRNPGDRAIAADLHHLLIAPVVGPATTGRPLIIVPDEVLHAVPFAALRDRKSGRYLVEDHRISMAATPEPGLPRRVRPLRSALVIGNPTRTGAMTHALPNLPDSEREAREIAAGYQGGFLLVRDEPTRRRVMAEMPRFDVVHFAGHGVASERDPGSSALLLAATGDEGVMYAREISRLDLTRVRLLVLAGCGTAEGRISAHEGMTGVAHAALAAGAEQVVATLGNLSDTASAFLFPRFHRELLGGLTAADALREAQMAMIRSDDPALNAPESWGPVELLTAAP